MTLLPKRARRRELIPREIEHLRKTLKRFTGNENTRVDIDYLCDCATQLTQERQRREQAEDERDRANRDCTYAADRLATIERGVRELAEHKDRCAEAALACPDSHNQHKVQAEDYQRQAKELRALIDAPEGGR